MKNMKVNATKRVLYPVMFLLMISVPALAIFAGGWRVKSDGAEVRFSGGRINGTFGGLKADIQFDKAHPEQSKITASIDVNSVATGFFLKNSHAKDALGADEHPSISFTSTSISKSGNGYEAAGKLTMRGSTKPATIHFTFDDKGNEGVFKGEMKVIPKEYGIDRSGTPESVTVYLTVPVSKA